MKARQTFEQLLVTHCAPTLAGLKMASLFNYEHGGKEQLQQVLSFWKAQLKAYGLHLDILRENPKKALVYVYWEQKLECLMQKEQVRRILMDCGYEQLETGNVLEQLKLRMTGSGCFPHEIGLFLGYPLADVIGFIENQGKNCCMCGYWKVYCDEYQAKKTFRQYTRCRMLYQQMFQEGVSVVQLIGARA